MSVRDRLVFWLILLASSHSVLRNVCGYHQIIMGVRKGLPLYYPSKVAVHRVYKYAKVWTIIQSLSKNQSFANYTLETTRVHVSRLQVRIPTVSLSLGIHHSSSSPSKTIEFLTHIPHRSVTCVPQAECPQYLGIHVHRCIQ